MPRPLVKSQGPSAPGTDSAAADQPMPPPGERPADPSDQAEPDLIEEVKAALERPRPEDKPADPTAEDRSGARRRVNWRWVRRGLYAATATMLVVPVVTFGMAYRTVEIPEPGDIHTNQVSTILAADGTELAKIIPPEGNRIDVKIDQVPVSVRNAVLAAEDRDFYTNSGYS
ncbi:MAG: penicillin-binding protein, partial [Mycobacterium sp.]